MASTKARSMVKAVTWRALSIAATTLFVWALTGEARFAVGVLFFDMFVMTGFYYVHERVWKAIRWGKFPTDWTHYGWTKEEKHDDTKG